MRDHAAFDLDILLDRLAAARMRLPHLRRAAAAGEDRQRHLHPRRRVRRFLEHADAGNAAVQRPEEIIIAAAQDRRHLGRAARFGGADVGLRRVRSEEHTSELQSLMRISYAVFCWKKKKTM